jgi:hypothetical protein
VKKTGPAAPAKPKGGRKKASSKNDQE